jgi:hypothetical protein
VGGGVAGFESANKKDDFMVAFLSFSKACGFTWV